MPLGGIASKIGSAAGGHKRALDLVFKGAKTASQKAKALKGFQSSKALQKSIFSKAGLAGKAKLSGVTAGGALLGATLAGAGAIRSAGKKLKKERQGLIKSNERFGKVLSEGAKRARKRVVAKQKAKKK